MNMMINKRLIRSVGESKKYIAANVALQWIGLAANIAMIVSVSSFLQTLYLQTADAGTFLFTAAVMAAAILIRFLCTCGAAKMGYLSSRTVKKKLRERIYRKLLRLGPSYKEQVSTSEVVQVSVEGVEQLETYFGSYLPQFFYSMIAPLTLFAVLSFVNIPSAAVLLLCVPLIPAAIAAVQTFAKKLLARYWGQYTELGDTFLENLQGLTTLKIYRADGYKNEEMNRESEKFRKITMKVLTMQLNSVTIMDLIAYGGVALGIVLSAVQYRAGNVTLAGCLSIILLSADFFIPMRRLGSFFHVAMNGMAACDKIFKLLDLPETERTPEAPFPQNSALRCENLSFSYQPEREILSGLNLEFPAGSFTALVGESGCGKSTVASILMGRNKNYSGTVTAGGVSLNEIGEDGLMKGITYVGFDSYLFKGTVRDNLKMGNPAAEDDDLWKVLKQVRLAEFVKSEQGLDTPLTERVGNLSGGQRQRLALARAILHDSPVYIFDEATSNVDVESENDIIAQICELARTRTVILITHRLANAVHADKIYVLQNGRVMEADSHDRLVRAGGVYSGLWKTQSELENYRKEALA